MDDKVHLWVSTGCGISRYGDRGTLRGQMMNSWMWRSANRIGRPIWNQGADDILEGERDRRYEARCRWGREMGSRFFWSFGVFDFFFDFMLLYAESRLLTAPSKIRAD